MRGGLGASRAALTRYPRLDPRNYTFSIDTSTRSMNGLGGLRAKFRQASGEFSLGKYGDFSSPRPTDSQSRHIVMLAWMKKYFPGYNSDEAPAILMPSLNHHRTFGIYNTWRVEMKERLGGRFDWGNVSEGDMRAPSKRMFDAAEVPPQMRAAYWHWFGRMKKALTQT